MAVIAPQLISAPRGIIRAGLHHHYDVGDARCYAGAGTVIADLCGNLNQASGGTAFNGVAGELSANEYFQFSGSNFWDVTPPSGALVRQLGRADTPFSIDAWQYRAAGRAVPLIDNKFAAVANGFAHWIDQSNYHYFDRGANLSTTTTLALTANAAWHYTGISIDPVAGTYAVLQANAAGAQTVTGAYASPWSGGESPAYYRIGRYGSSYAAAGSRLAIWRLYNRALSPDELKHNYIAQRGRFGI